MKFIIIHKEPIVERIPNLKAFITYALSCQHDVILLTTRSKIFPQPSFPSDRIKYHAVMEREAKLQIPTSIRFFLLCIFILIRNLFTRYSLVLAGRYALMFGAFLGFFRLVKFSSFIIEYPEFNPNKNNLSDKLEFAGIRYSNLLITHDRLHAEFICEKMNLVNLKYLTIPNGTSGCARKQNTKILHNMLGIDCSRNIILHSGGFGSWFSSAELAELSTTFPANFSLVFHVSHDISNNSYYLRYLKTRSINDRSIFSMFPVSSDRLDELVSSARIGVAWYSTAVLDYRAIKMGLAAGKIGNYLKCGIPVIVPNFDSLNYVIDYSCGIQVENLSDISDAISKIEKDYEFFSKNALRCYNELWNTEIYCKDVVDKLIEHI